MSERVIMMKSLLSSQYMSTLAMGIKPSPVMIKHRVYLGILGVLITPIS
jgi:hypothetical protein